MRLARTNLVASLLFLVSAAAAAQAQTDFGVAGNPARVTRTVNVDMTDDMRFSPATVEVKQGETVRFALANKGATMHEMVLGTPKDIARHAAMMAATAHGNAPSHMHHLHNAPSMAHVQPGANGEIVWQFNRPGTFEYACLIPGHYEAGMKGTVTVK